MAQHRDHRLNQQEAETLANYFQSKRKPGDDFEYKAVLQDDKWVIEIRDSSGLLLETL